MSLPHAPLPPRQWERVLPWLGAALGLLWFLVVGGGPTLDPTNLNWVGSGDHAQHVLGWLHFRNAPWGFPLGSMPSLMHPLPMMVGFTDSNPWVALALKPFSRWLPQDFQYIGLWLALCFALQGWMGVKLMELLSPGVPQRLLGAALFVTSPVLLYRLGHDTLCAHWMLLAMIWLHLCPRADARAAWRTVGWALALNVLAAGTHPYLEVMVFTLTVSLLATLAWVEHRLSWRSSGAVLAGVTGTVGAIFVLFGYVGQGITAGASGFGFYSADLLAIINPMGWSHLLPSLPYGPGQYEGFGYLGTGSLALAGVLLLGWPVRWWPRAKAAAKTQAPLALAVLALSLLAFSSVMTVASREVLTMRNLVKPILPLLAPFRSSGRFIWLLDYALLTSILALVAWRWRQHPRVVTALLLGAVVLQIGDTQDLWDRTRLRGQPWPRLEAPEWASVDPFYRHIVLFPPSILRFEREPCDKAAFREDTYVRFGDLAYRKGMTTNSVYPARFDEPKVLVVCKALQSDIESGRFAEDTLYVVEKKKWAAFQRPELTCGVLDGYRVCVAAKRSRFQEALARAAPTSWPVPEGASPSASSPP